MNLSQSRIIQIIGACVVIALCAIRPAMAQERKVVDLSGPGWKLWFDKSAKWQYDGLFLPDTPIDKIPTNAPTGGWDALASAPAVEVSVPATAEEYFGKGRGPEDGVIGVTWWYRTIHIPEGKNTRAILRFGAVRQRAEVYLDQKLVGYDIVGNTPFTVDISNFVKPGEDHQLAVRITNPGGNYEWRDTHALMWGNYKLPISHGFGGITGNVSLVSCDSIYIDDVYVQNTPEARSVNVQVSVQNTTGEKQSRDLKLIIEGSKNTTQSEQKVDLQPGANTFITKITVPDAKLWDIDHPNLYTCDAELGDAGHVTDLQSQVFGFRWFSAEGEGQDGMFRLNGKRIVLRSSISWGFWPINGMIPTPELARKQIEVAKNFGLNMLNFHRAIGQPIMLDDADQMGLLYYEEPGGYVTGDGNEFADALRREKLLRMVKRDRSHPSLVMYSMINEAWDSLGAGTNPDILGEHIRDLKDAHAIDPSRMIIHTSAWVGAHRGKAYPADADPARMHMLPFDDAVHMLGFFDFHRAGGPAVWNQELYTNPTKYYGYTDDVEDIRFNGEEGAISTPPRLELIAKSLEKSPRPGWDSGVYKDWYKQFNDFLDKNDLRAAFPTVESLCVAMGNISMYHQGRKIENFRMSNVNDDYTINGWEAEIIENHSGIVDCWRNPKGDPAILAYYNQPIYVAVKCRDQVSSAPGTFTVDFFLINEKDVKGDLMLKISATDPSGKVFFTNDIPVSVTGGDVYGQLLTQAIKIPVGALAGHYVVSADLVDSTGTTQASGREDELAVEWQNAKISDRGASMEAASKVVSFLQDRKGLKVPAYTDYTGPLDWIVATKPPGEDQPTLVAADRYTDLSTQFFAGSKFENPIASRKDKKIDMNFEEGATPDPNVGLTDNFAVRWTGQINPPATGRYTVQTDSSGGIRLTIDGHDVFENLDERGAQIHSGQVKLEAGKPVKVQIDFIQITGSTHCKLLWSPPRSGSFGLNRLADRISNDGTTLVILDSADSWMPFITSHTSATYAGSFIVGKAWLGGLHFVREHPLFKDLPVNCGMDWPYQDVVRDGANRSGLLLDGGTLVAGAYHSYPMQLGTAVGIIPLGKGKIIVSTLDIASNLDAKDSAANVPRKLLCNFLEFATKE